MLHRLKKLSTTKSDFLGISTSFLCLIHCLAFPVLMSAGYIFNYSLSEHWHGLDYFFVLLGIVAVAISSKNSPIRSLKLAFWLTICVFSISILFHHSWHGMIYISTTASVILIVLHFVHYKLHVKCDLKITKTTCIKQPVNT